MTTPNPAPAVPPANPADELVDQKPNNLEAILASRQVILDEKKKLQDELDAFKKDREQAERKKLEDTQQWEKLAKDRETELKKVQDESAALKRNLLDGAKLSAFLDTVGGDVEKQYWKLIDVDAINIDPVTNLPDELSVKKAVESFKKQFPLVIKSGNRNRMPNEAANGKSHSLSYEAWKSLSFSDQKKRHDEVDWDKVL